MPSSQELLRGLQPWERQHLSQYLALIEKHMPDDKCPKCDSERETAFPAGDGPGLNVTIWKCGSWSDRTLPAKPIDWFNAHDCLRRQLARAKQALDESESRLATARADGIREAAALVEKYETRSFGDKELTTAIAADLRKLAEADGKERA